jgi:hypothetical protein
MRLRDHQIRLQLADQFHIDLIQRFARVQTAADFGVDLSARNGNIESRLAARWKLLNPGRVVAFMRPAHQRLART